MIAIRMKRLPHGIAALAVLLILSACASQIMKSYIGAPISSVMLDYGPPDNVYDLGPGARAYQWRKEKTQVVPVNPAAKSGIRAAASVMKSPKRRAMSSIRNVSTPSIPEAPVPIGM